MPPGRLGSRVHFYFAQSLSGMRRKRETWGEREKPQRRDRLGVPTPHPDIYFSSILGKMEWSRAGAEGESRGLAGTSRQSVINWCVKPLGSALERVSQEENDFSEGFPSSSPTQSLQQTQGTGDAPPEAEE